jgi:hypothetical protein
MPEGSKNMNTNLKKTIAFFFFLLAGMVVGSVVAELLRDVSALSFLSRIYSVGLSTDAPLVLDLIIFKLAFGFTLSVSLSQIFFVIISLIIYAKVMK